MQVPSTLLFMLLMVNEVNRTYDTKHKVILATNPSSFVKIFKLYKMEKHKSKAIIGTLIFHVLLLLR